MDWIFIAVVGGSILTSGHPTEESCLGRKEMLVKQQIYGTCIRRPDVAVGTVISGGGILYLNNVTGGQK